MSTTKRITKRLLAVVLTVMMLMSMVTIGMTSASAAKVDLAPTGYDFAANTKVYFDLSGLNWPSNYKVEIMLGHSTWSATYEMSKVANTDLYYVNLPSWGGATEFCVIANSSAWGDEGNSPSHRRSYASYKTAIYKMSGNFSGVFALYPNSANTTLTPEYKGTTYSALNANQNVAVQSNVSGAYAADTAAATVAINTYKLTGNSTAGASTASGATATASAARGANVTLSYSDVAEGYTFAGWYEGDTLLSEDATYTFNFDGGSTNDYTARFDYTATEVPSSSEDASEDASSSADASASEDASSSTGEVESQPASSGSGDTDPEETNGTAMAASDWFKSNGLYAYAGVTDTVGPDAWQRWDSVSGKDYRYFYLPCTASDTEVIIYNSYSKTIEINGVKIDAGCYNTVPYENGTVYDTTGDYSVKIMKSDAEGAIYINNPATEYKDENKNVISNTDLYAFLTGGSKNREAKGSGAVASADGIIDYEVEKDGEMIGAASVKKIKGRGNSTWNLAKKPFNITFNENIKLDGMKGKKWSLLANAQDPSLLRNRLVYDLANEVNMTYACDSRFVDWFVNGDYKGSYQLTQKIEMGKNTVMPDLEEPLVEVEEEGDVVPTADFDFILELDTKENAQSSGDKGFTTTKGQWMTFKTPDAPTDEQITFIKAKYQAVENALYSGDIATLETLVDLDDFARAYLINEVAKNLDAGVTSCYFTFNFNEDTGEGKFTTAPVWDYDNALGNSVSISGRHDKNGKMLDVTGPSGWYARDLMHYAISGTLNVFGQACATTKTNAAGETFNDVVKRIWNDEFMPALAVLEGTATAANGRLNTVEGYLANLKDSGQWNYNYAKWDLTANNGWVADHSNLVMYDYDADANTLNRENKSYDQYTLEGQANYAGDWLISRMNWLAAQFADAEEADAVLPAAKDGYMRIFFTNEWKWTDVKIHIWNSKLQSDTTWPGQSMTFFENNGAHDVYYAYVPTDAYFIFNGIKDDGSGNRDQSPDIKSGAEDGLGYYMFWDNANTVKTYTDYIDLINKEETTTSTPVEDTTVEDTTVTEPGTTVTTPASSPDEEDTTVTEPGTTVTTPAETTMTIYFENNWKWPDLTIYWWGSETGTNPAWKTQKMTYVDTTKDGNDRYVIEVPTDVDGIIFAGTGEYGFEQSANIESGWYDGICYYMNYENNTKLAKSYKYEPLEEESTVTEPGTTVTTPASSPDEEGTTVTTPVDTGVTVYVVNSVNWDKVQAYAWTKDPAVAWPGEEMTLKGVYGTFNVYEISYDEAYANIIFNNKVGDTGAQTADLELMDGQYYDLKTAKWYENLEDVPFENPLATNNYLAGSFNGWSQIANEFMLEDADGKVGYVTLTLDANTTYEFKVIRNGAWTSNSTPITDSVTDAVFSSGVNDNAKLTTKEAGEYVFAYYDSKLTVTYPVSGPSTDDEEETDPLATNRYLVGTFNDWDETANEFMRDHEGGNTGYVTLTLDANTTYEFKIIREGKWTAPKTATTITDSITELTFSSSGTEKVKLTTKEAGEYVFAFGVSSSQLAVTYPVGEDVTDPDDTTPDDTTPDDTTPADVKVALPGSFNDWNKEAYMADNGDGTYTMVLDLEAGEYTFKIKVNDEWFGKNTEFNDNTTDTSDVGWTMKADEGNATLNATGGKYTFIFNTETDRLIIEHVPAEVETPVYNITVLNEGNFTVNAPATLDEGAILEFTVEADEDYKIAAVIADMVELVPDEFDVYYYGEVTGDVSIFVVAVEDNSNDTPIVIPTDPEDTTAPETEPTEPTTPIVVKTWTVMFVDDNNNIIAVAKVEDGKNLPAPQAPEKAGYTFTGWSQDTSNVTKDMLVVAQYKKNASDVPAPVITTGKLQVEVSGGTGFTINGRPQGTSYMNTKMTIGTSVTLVASTTNGNEFMGWMNATTGAIVSTTETLTFTASGGDFFKAVYKTSVDSVNLVVFKNDKAAGGNGQILDMQYYAAGDEVVFPADPGRPGYDFAGWDHTAEQIQTKLAAGQDVTILPTWKVKEVYVKVSVNGGAITSGGATDGNGGYRYNQSVTVKADAAPEGQKFAYWVDQNGKVNSYNAEYTFLAYFDTELTAVYVGADEEIEYEAIVGISANTTVDDVRIGYSYFWEVPAELGTFVQGGVLVVEQKNYNEATFIAGVKAAGLDANVTEANPAAAQVNPLAGFTSNKTGSQLGTYWYAKSYVQYRDANGEIQTVYSDMIEAAKS